MTDTADPFDPGLVLGGVGYDLLSVFNRAGLLAPADVHGAARLCRLVGETSSAVALAVALAIRAPRVGHVRVDLASAQDSVLRFEDGGDEDLSGLPWPEARGWLSAVAASRLVSVSPPGGEQLALPGVTPETPLHLDGTHLYLDRFWNDELFVAADLRARTDDGQSDVGADVDALARLFPGEESAEQAAAAAVALSGRLTVIAGGPGTGKTTTVARLLARLFERAEDGGTRPPLVALAAPTGKAAARMEQAVRSVSAGLDTRPSVAARLASLGGSTLHRLLGRRPDDSGRFRHHRGHLLPHDVVVVDEASMVSLALMARLLEAVRPDARLILVGDPEQLVSVEAGAVLADIVGSPQPDRPEEAPSTAPGAPSAGPPPSPLDGKVCLLRRNHRFGGAIADLAEAIRVGADDAAIAVLRHGDESARWLDVDAGDVAHRRGAPAEAAGAQLRGSVVGWATSLRHAAGQDPGAALAVLGASRVLCGHRRGDAGVATWNQVIERWLAADAGVELDRAGWYPGRPVLVTANDYARSLFNGDGGVVVTVPAGPGDAGGAVRVAFEGSGTSPRLVSPFRLRALETVYAMTVHKSQGSEFDHVTFLLPASSSRLLTRELVYTAVTRAKKSVVVVGTEEALRAALQHPIARASGLDARLRSVGSDRSGPGPG